MAKRTTSAFYHPDIDKAMEELKDLLERRVEILYVAMDFEEEVDETGALHIVPVMVTFSDWWDVYVWMVQNL